MKIAYIAGWPIPSRAANAVHVMKMCQAYASCGHEVLLIHPAGSHDDLTDIDNLFEHYGVEQNFKMFSVQMPKGRLGLLSYAVKAARCAKKHNVDLVHSRCLMSAWVASLFGLRVIFEKHDSLDGQGKIARAVFRVLLKSKNLAKLVVISDALKEHLSERFQIPQNRIIAAHDGADPFPDTQVKPAFDKIEGKLHVGYIGHLYKGRGIDVIADIAKSLTDVEFHIVGGTQEDLSYWKTTLSKMHNVHFYGYVPHSETIGYLKHLDVLLAPYQKKVGGYAGKGNTVQWMSPLKIFEYMATGIPMICSDLSVLHEILEDKRNVFLCAPDNSDEWVETIRYIQDNREEAQDIANTAKAEFLSKYTWKKRSEHIADNVS